MSSDATDMEAKKPKLSSSGPTSIPTQDKPSFASRRRPQNAQRRLQFTTDSMNTSYIPSPSPPRKQPEVGVGAKPRQALGSGRTLAGTSRATPGERKGIKSPWSQSSGARQRTQSQPQQQLRRPQQQKTVLGSPSPSIKQSLPRRSVTRTPSPSRARPADIPISPTSPASVSSPPGGLAEAYQRIEVEESLAGQEDRSVDEIQDIDPVMAGEQGQHADEDGRRNLRGPNPSSTGLRGGTTQTLENTGKETEEPLEEEEYTQNSIGSSNLSSLSRSGGDTFQRILTQHARDERRLKAVLANDTHPFRKARMRERNGLTIENLQRKDASSLSGSSTLGSPSISSKGSELALNVPQQWGLKARNGKTWLSRFSRDDSRAKNDGGSVSTSEKPMDMAPELGRRRFSNQMVDWMVAGDEKTIPTFEEDFVPAASSVRKSTPTRRVRGQASLEKIRRWEFLDDDFTARSLQISDSPPIKIRNAALDAIREREIQNLEKSAVTTNRLGELKEKRSVENIRRRSPSVASEAKSDEADKVGGDMKGKRSHSSLSILNPRSEEDEKEDDPVIIHKDQLLENRDGEVVPKSPAVVCTPEVLGSTSESGGAGKEISVRPLPQRPSHERSDSRDLLRRLARATSASPSPSPSPPKCDMNQEEIPATKGPNQTESVFSLSETRPKQVQDSVEYQESGESEMSASTKSLQSYHGPEQTPQQARQKTYLKTPLVTGAWIETPLHSKLQRTLNTESASSDQKWDPAVALDPVGLMKLRAENSAKARTSLEETAPALPTSALAAILERAKSKSRGDFDGQNGDATDDTLRLDDSTIQSLEDLLATHNELFGPLTPPTSPPNPDYKPAPVHSTNPAVNEDVDSYDHLTARLSALGTSIREAKKGIASLERAVSTVPSTSVAPTTGECAEAGEIHDFLWPCSRCGCSGVVDMESWQPLCVPKMRDSFKLWTWSKGDSRPRATWLGVGLLTLGGLMWVNTIVEYALFHPGLPQMIG